MTRLLGRIAGTAIVAIAVLSTPARSGLPGDADAYRPVVPVSAFARPAAWLDPARLHVATSVSVGSGFSGTTRGLQVTSFAYQFARPAWLEVSLGNAFGGGSGRGNGLFLEGIRFGFRPSPSTVFQIQFRDVRSPLQYSRDPFASSVW